MDKWNGDERRNDSRDHDLLTKIDANLSNFMIRFGEHVVEDDKKFDDLNNKTDNLNKYLWMGMGGLAVVQFFIVKFFAK